MKQTKVRQTWHHESSVSALSRFTMGNVSSIASLKRIPIDVLFRPARRPEYTVYSSPHFQVQRSTNLPSDFHFNSHFKACKRLRLPFHYWPINSTISGSVTSIWKPSKTSPTKRPLRSAACVCLGCIHCPWLAHCNLCQMVSQLLFLWEAQREELRGLHRCSEEKTSSTSSGFILGLSRGMLRLLRRPPDEVFGQNWRTEITNSKKFLTPKQ